MVMIPDFFHLFFFFPQKLKYVLLHSSVCSNYSANHLLKLCCSYSFLSLISIMCYPDKTHPLESRGRTLPLGEFCDLLLRAGVTFSTGFLSIFLLYPMEIAN